MNPYQTVAALRKLSSVALSPTAALEGGIGAATHLQQVQSAGKEEKQPEVKTQALQPRGRSLFTSMAVFGVLSHIRGRKETRKLTERGELSWWVAGRMGVVAGEGEEPRTACCRLGKKLHRCCFAGKKLLVGRRRLAGGTWSLERRSSGALRVFTFGISSTR